ncbi:hypothetical protein ABB37_03616 [Leptomonas pyrrhocoris]|uniref:Uncharacterized protein n=1 Tax=Leptomonas pyrrhocoris TaxID=157538 RepID=A0A0M9G5I3_LEPPY|nr:hypothetical protein ABB37_03616 [Leptomonas pyrrhocoris]XP_015661028.1 hypothetical protein ABB37_03616 [Leptomonas pyrrhocoris]KPA82588.1 hypothetical protein ABB37_03616 [Leptomonas pyrrhocoris]KPA82589.1 hypothetical protein ABB37_03616 [Leptomonas pyrrhocoris]|eukprot:XP_015661027.1 hypothetical protein ABB37_03616 [Leptomonas pyrrhocoris]
MSTAYLDELLRKNARLIRKVYTRASFVEYELDRLRGLRVGLALADAPSRKRRRSSEQVLHSTSPCEPQNQTAELSPAFVVALKAEVQKHRGRGASFRLHNKADWEDVAAALHDAGHHSWTPYELLTAFKKLGSASRVLTTAEIQTLCQLVREKGYDWPAICNGLWQRFGHELQPFDVAQQYRSCMRCAFVQARLTSSQLAALLDGDSVSAQHRDYDQLSVEANRFVANKSLQVDPRCVQKEMDALAFARYVPDRYRLFWKVANLLYRLPLPYPCRLDTFHHKMPLCYQQLSVEDLSRCLECTVEELRKKVVDHLLSLSRSPDTLNFEECSKRLFGNSTAARVIYQIAEELHERGS